MCDGEHVSDLRLQGKCARILRSWRCRPAPHSDPRIRRKFMSNELVNKVRAIAGEVAGQHADDVDQKARFPAESIAALKAVKAMSAAVPKELGGGGCDMRELAAMCSALAQGCGSSAMVL